MSDATEPVSLVDLIDQLVDPPVPEPVSMVPETAGWWIVGAVAALALAWGVRRLWLHWRANAYRREALMALASTGDDPATIATILRRTALAGYRRREVAGLAGEDWIAFLRKTGRFPESAGEALLRAPYAPGADAGELRRVAETWIRTHRRPS